MAGLTAPNYEEIKKQITNLYAPSKQAEIKAQKNTAAASKATINTNYGAQIGETERSYDDQYRINAVQKLINEQAVAESMANNGLTNSGLNRTQQTAVQLSYANQKASLDRQKQSAVDALTREMTAKLTEIDTNLETNLAGIETSYAQQIAADTQKNYSAQMDAYNTAQQQINDYNIEMAKINKEDSKPKNIISANGAPLSRDFEGSLSDNYVTVTYNTDSDGMLTTTTYYDKITGKKTTVAYSVNPYTNTNNAVGSSDTAKAWNEHGHYDNGYQPKGVFYNGKDYGTLKFSGITDVINGNRQNVHKTKDGSLWIWDGKRNKYIPYEE